MKACDVTTGQYTIGQKQASCLTCSPGFYCVGQGASLTCGVN